jgi:hypothetical protein
MRSRNWLALVLGTSAILLGPVTALFGRAALFRSHPRNATVDLRKTSGFTLRAGSSNLPCVEYYGEEPPKRAVVLMDAFCPYHGLYLANAVRVRFPDTAVVTALSDYLYAFLSATEPESQAQWDSMRVPQDETTLAIWQSLPVAWQAVYCESDSGLESAEALREVLGVACRDKPVMLSARRHKYKMNDRVKSVGLESVKQKMCDSLDEAQAFAQELGLSTGESLQAVIVKPFRGVASESVHLCHDNAEIESAWNSITSTAVFGCKGRHDSVLVQEFLQGCEYAVDVVLRDGVPKVAAVWRYDKTQANGAPFCYVCTRLVDSHSDPQVPVVCDYVLDVLRALGVKWGLSHNEVIVTSDRGPVLVEVNCRQHNMDFCPLTMACIGYNALDMTVDALLGDEESWKVTYPAFPALRAQGCMVHLINYASGVLNEVKHLEEIDALPSVLKWEVYDHFREPGIRIEPTVDIRSDAGWVQLVHEDLNTLEHNYEQLVAWMPTMFQAH